MTEPQNRLAKVQQALYELMIPKEALNGRPIANVSYYPLDDRPIVRSHHLAKAYQTDEGENGLNVFCEPCWLTMGTRIKIIKTVEATGLLKGATGIVTGLKGNDERLVVELDNGGGRLSLEDPTSWVVDADYRFVYFARVNTSGRDYLAADSSTPSGFARYGHFTQADNALVHSIRYKGPLTKELAVQLREQFESEKPGLLRLEERGEAAYLMLSHYPHPTREPHESDQFVHRRCVTELNTTDVQA